MEYIHPASKKDTFVYFRLRFTLADKHSIYTNVKILVLCTSNSARNQMAQGFLQSFDSNLPFWYIKNLLGWYLYTI